MFQQGVLYSIHLFTGAKTIGACRGIRAGRCRTSGTSRGGGVAYHIIILPDDVFYNHPFYGNVGENSELGTALVKYRLCLAGSKSYDEACKGMSITISNEMTVLPVEIDFFSTYVKYFCSF